MGLWEVISHEGGDVMNEICALIKKTPESSLILLTCEGTGRSQLVCEQVNSSSSDTESAGALILNFPASRTVRNKCLLF